MEQQNPEEPPIQEKSLSKDALYKRQYRLNQKLKKEGILPPNYLLEAKEILLNELNLDIQALKELERFKDNLTEKNYKQLEDFKKNHLQKLKREEQLERAKSQIGENLQNEAQRLALSDVNSINSRISSLQTKEQVEALVKSLMETDVFSFITYLDEIQPTEKELLEVIINQCIEKPSQESTQIFIKICKNPNNHHLEVQAPLIEAAMVYLNENLEESQAVFGLLKFILSNGISLTDFQIDTVKQFQEQYGQHVNNFFKNNSQLKNNGQNILPATIFCFTKPILDQIKGPGHLIYQNFHHGFQYHLLQIIGKSFNNSEDELNELMKVFKQLISQHNQMLQSYKFVKLLEEMLQLTQDQSKGYFRTLIASIRILKQVLKLANEKRLPVLTGIQIKKFLEGENEGFAEMDQAPKIIKAKSEFSMLNTFATFMRNNPTLELDDKILCQNLTKEEETIIKILGFSNLLPNQHILFKYYRHANISATNMFQLDTGQGKTALCLLLALSAALDGNIVFIVNKSEDLTFRDYKKAYSLAEAADVKVQMIDIQIQNQIFDQGIVYSSSNDFIQKSAYFSEEDLKDNIFIFDEFDSLLFEETILAQTYIKLFRRMDHVFGLSGSLFELHHKNFLQVHCNSLLINFSMSNQDKPVPHCHMMEVFSNIKEWRKGITCQSAIISILSPSIIINEFDHVQLSKTLKNSGLIVEDLVDAKPEFIDSSLKQFAIKTQNLHRIVIISSSQARGLDFQTNQEIENNGGIHVLIAELPSKYLHYQQYLGRTNRIGNKGQISVFLFDKTAKGKEGQDYFNVMIENLKNEDFKRISTFVEDKLENEVANNQMQEEQKVDHQPNKVIIEEAKFLQNEEVKDVEIGSEQQIQIQIPSQIEKIDDQPPTLIKKRQYSKRGKDQQNPSNEAQTFEAFRKRELKQLIKINKKQAKDSKLTYSFVDEIEAGYFGGYSGEDIHSEMIKDESRMEAYYKGLIQICDQKTVLEVGTGTGVLAIQAARAGAVFVHAIEASIMAKHANDNCKLSDVGSKIKVYNDRVEEVVLSPESTKVDVIFSEWMGYFLLYENVLQSVLIAKDRFLKVGGRMMPSECRIYIAPYDNEANEIHNDDFMKEGGDQHFCNADIDNKFLLAEPREVFDIDINKVKDFDNSFHRIFIPEIFRDGVVGGFVGWFEADMTEGIVLSTSPHKQATHWHQQLFKVKEPYEVKRGDLLKNNISCKPQAANYRALDVEISYETHNSEKQKKQLFKIN